MGEKEITSTAPLLEKSGELLRAGWARHPLFVYNRSAVKAPFFKTKEWDDYAIINEKKGYIITLTFADLGCKGLFALSFADLNRKKTVQLDYTQLLIRHKTGLGESSLEDNFISFTDQEFHRLTFTVVKKRGERHIIFNAPTLCLPDGSKGLLGDFTFIQDQELETMNTARGWKENRRTFCLGEKIIGLVAKEGFIRFEDKKDFVKEDGVLGLMDWGRCRWIGKNSWCRAAALSLRNGARLGFCLCGGKDEPLANAIFIDDRLYKLDEVEFTIPSNPQEKWKIKDEKGQIDLTFTPLAPQSTKLRFLGFTAVKNDQYFGTFSGHIIDRDGNKRIIDELAGLAGRLYNKW